MKRNNPPEIKSIIILMPRFHTNFVGIVSCMKKNLIEVNIIAATTGFTEDHTDVKPIILKESWFSKFLAAITGGYGPNRLGYFPSFYTLYKTVQKIAPDACIIRRYNTRLDVMTSLVCKLLKIKIISYDQISYETRIANHGGTLRGLCRRILFNSYLSLFSATWVTTIPNRGLCLNWRTQSENFLPFTVKVKNPKRTNHRSGYRILSIGKYQQRKNHDLVIKAIALARPSSNLSLTIVGENSSDEHEEVLSKLKTLVVQLDVSERVTMLQNVKYQDMDPIYLNNDILVMASVDEPAAVVVVEALGAGLPVISSSKNGTANYIRNLVTGVIFDPDEPETLSSALSYVCSSPDVFEQMSVAAVCDAEKNFSCTALINSLKSL